MSPPALPAATDAALLEALDHGAAWIDRTGRSRLDVTGPDRAKFLHNLTTNDVRRLPAGRGCEAFVTSLQGKTLGFVTLHVGDDRILLRADAGGLDALLPHFGKYGALEDVAWDDASGRTFEYHLVGPKSGEAVQTLGGEVPPPDDLAHHATTLAGRPVLVVRESPTLDPGLTIVGDAPDAEAVASALTGAGRPLGLVRMSPEQFEALRIEAGTPVFGRDLDASNLPQEADRDRRAISFTKGCYLGQETVARLDALGHVNKVLRGLRLASEAVPPPGSALLVDGKEVGRLGSAARAIRGVGVVGLALVRVAQAGPGTELRCAGEGFEVVGRVASLPMT
jgi:folate-binding protein YgfZ